MKGYIKINYESKHKGKFVSLVNLGRGKISNFKACLIG